MGDAGETSSSEKAKNPYQDIINQFPYDPGPARYPNASSPNPDLFSRANARHEIENASDTADPTNWLNKVEWLTPPGQDGWLKGRNVVNIHGVTLPSGDIMSVNYQGGPQGWVYPMGYASGAGANLWGSYNPTTRSRLTTSMVGLGLLPKSALKTPDASSMEQHKAWDEVLGVANFYGVTPFYALSKWNELVGSSRRGRGGGGGGGRSTAITIPDYPTIAQRSKDIFRSILGRQPEDWEITLIADEMQSQYRKAAETSLQASLAGNGTFEIPDPSAVTQKFVEDTYRDEVKRRTTVAETGVNNQLLIAAATRGAKVAGAGR